MCIELCVNSPDPAETSVQQASKQVQVDLQDLGYETCGRSENEAEREDASSPGDPQHYRPDPYPPHHTPNNVLSDEQRTNHLFLFYTSINV